MTIKKAMTAGAAAISLLMASGTAFAGTAPSAANKLSLIGAEGVSGVNECIKLEGRSGKWQRDSAGNWVRCGGKGGFLGGAGLYVLLGLAAVGGGVAAATSGGSKSP